MKITLLQTILIFLTSCFIGIESILDEFQLHRPIIACTLIGLVLNDIKTGIKIGSILEMMALGWMNIGASVAPDTALASIISTILVILGKQSIGSGIAISIPLSVTGQILTIIVRSITIAFQHFADEIVENENSPLYISYIHIIALLLQAMRIAIPSLIISLSVNTQLIQNILNSIPVFITDGLNTAGSIVVVVGYAMVINMMETKSLMPFFYLGFIITAFTEFNLVSLGILGTILAILYIQLSPKYNILNKQTENKNIKDNELD